MSLQQRVSPTLTLFLVLFVVSVGFGLIIPILPLLTRAYGASPFALGAMAASYSVVQFIFAPIWGGISDRVGRKPILLVGITGVSVSFIVMGFAESFAGLFWARVLGGFLASATLPAAQALAAELTGNKDRSRAMGLMGAAFGIGFVVGPVVGGLLAPLGLAAPFLAAGVLGAFTVLLAALVLREPDSSGASEGEDSDEVLGRRMGGATLLRNVQQALKGPGAPYYVLAFVIMFTQSCLMTALAYFLTDRFGVGVTTIGMILALNGAFGAAIQGGAIGPLTERWGDRTMILVGLGVGAAGFLGLAVAPNLALGIGAVLLMAVSMSLTRPTATSALSKVTTLPQGVTMGVQSSFDSLGRVIGPLWAGYAYELSHSAPFVSTAVIGLLALWYVAVRTRKKSDPRRSLPSY